MSAAHTCCNICELQVADFLLSLPSTNINSSDQSSTTPLQAAIRSGKRSVVEWVIRNNAIMEKNICLLAATVGNVEILRCLISAGADLSVKDDKGRSLVMLAASSGQSSCLELLLSLGCDVDDVDDEGVTALTAAIINNDVESAAVMLQRGARLDSVDCSGRTALDIAIYQASASMVEILLDNGANMETPDCRGIRPLDRVIGHGCSEIVSVFLRKGAKLSGSTWAMAQSQPHIQLILLNKLLEDGNTFYRQHKLLEASHRYKYALKRLSSILNSDWSIQDHTWPMEMEISLLLNLSRTERRLGRHQSARSLASRVLEKQPNNVQALCTRAKAARSLGMFREAFLDFNSALEMMPDNVELRRVILKLKKGFTADMSSSFMSFTSHDSIKFIDDSSADIEA